MDILRGVPYHLVYYTLVVYSPFMNLNLLELRDLIFEDGNARFVTWHTRSTRLASGKSTTSPIAGRAAPGVP